MRLRSFFKDLFVPVIVFCPERVVLSQVSIQALKLVVIWTSASKNVQNLENVEPSLDSFFIARNHVSVLTVFILNTMRYSFFDFIVEVGAH